MFNYMSVIHKLDSLEHISLLGFLLSSNLSLFSSIFRFDFKNFLNI